MRIRPRKKGEAPATPQTAAPQAEKRRAPFEEALRAVVGPHIAEKGTRLSERRQYVFRVEKGATKPQVKSAVEKLYGVKVGRVNVISVPGKKKRLGRTEGFRPGYKKAVVTLKEGKIEFS